MVCDTKHFVALNGLWHWTVCYTEHFVALNGLWHWTVCDTERFVTLTSLWHWTVCDTEQFVILNGLWHWTVCDIEQFVTLNSLWHWTVCNTEQRLLRLIQRHTDEGKNSAAVEWNRYTEQPSLSVRESLLTGIPYHAVFRLIATYDIPPKSISAINRREQTVVLHWSLTAFHSKI
jgi:hypothetical protein